MTTESDDALSRGLAEAFAPLFRADAVRDAEIEALRARLVAVEARLHALEARNG